MRKDTRIKNIEDYVCSIGLDHLDDDLRCAGQSSAIGAGVPRWHGDIRHFTEHDVVVWRGGHWVHGWHVSRFGWWWVIPGGWYFYPAPVYPYPDPYAPPVVAVQPAPPVVQAQPQAQTWYYCDRPSGYYPYIPECSSGWKDSASNTSAAYRIWFTSTSGAISGVKYERETILHDFVSHTR